MAEYAMDPDSDEDQPTGPVQLVPNAVRQAVAATEGERLAAVEAILVDLRNEVRWLRQRQHKTLERLAYVAIGVGAGGNILSTLLGG